MKNKIIQSVGDHALGHGAGLLSYLSLEPHPDRVISCPIVGGAYWIQKFPGVFFWFNPEETEVEDEDIAERFGF